MMLSPVSPPSSLSAADRPGAMLNIEPPPGGTTNPFISIIMTSEYSFDIPQIRDGFRPESLVRAFCTNGKSRAACSRRSNQGSARYNPEATSSPEQPAQARLDFYV